MTAIRDRVLGNTGLLLIALMVWASSKGRPGRAIIALVTVIGRIADYKLPSAPGPGAMHHVTRGVH